MLDLNDFIAAVHANSIAHGWWDTDRTTEELLSLIHSEWSEALEEYRNARPKVWHKCQAPSDIASTCNAGTMICDRSVCEFALSKDYQHPKPEGIAVELADGVIRIFDFIGAIGGRLDNQSTIGEVLECLHEERKKDCDAPLPVFICYLHCITSEALRQDDEKGAGTVLMTAAAMVMYWLKKNGIDPEAVLTEKHKYNKTRMYKHGNKLC